MKKRKINFTRYYGDTPYNITLYRKNVEGSINNDKELGDRLFGKVLSHYDSETLYFSPITFEIESVGFMSPATRSYMDKIEEGAKHERD